MASGPIYLLSLKKRNKAGAVHAHTHVELSTCLYISFKADHVRQLCCFVLQCWLLMSHNCFNPGRDASLHHGVPSFLSRSVSVEVAKPMFTSDRKTCHIHFGISSPVGPFIIRILYLVQQQQQEKASNGSWVFRACVQLLEESRLREGALRTRVCEGTCRWVFWGWLRDFTDI